VRFELCVLSGNFSFECTMHTLREVMATLPTAEFLQEVRSFEDQVTIQIASLALADAQLAAKRLHRSLAVIFATSGAVLLVFGSLPNSTASSPPRSWEPSW
jgi:hypothetical protein